MRPYDEEPTPSVIRHVEPVLGAQRVEDTLSLRVELLLVTAEGELYRVRPHGSPAPGTTCIPLPAASEELKVRLEDECFERLT